MSETTQQILRLLYILAGFAVPAFLNYANNLKQRHKQLLMPLVGTALAIADGISESLKEAPEYVYDRHSVRKMRAKNEIGLHAIRGGTIVGEHDVLFAGPDEVITLSHSAGSRDVFAQGAVRAAKFMAGKPAGFYSMDDLFADLV